MRTLAPIAICENNLSSAWGRAFQHAFKNPNDASPLTVSFSLSPTGEPQEDSSVRNAVDQALKSQRKPKVSVRENAEMLFPSRTWERCRTEGREAFYEQYKTQVLPRIRQRVKGNFYGTYFERLIDYEGVNQLEHIIEFWERSKASTQPHRPRPAALVAACFDPRRDQKFQALRGFPCLQQVSFAYDRHGDGLAISAFYPCQYIFDRGYGNYLGLSHLGMFMADQLKLRLVRVNCFVAVPLLGHGLTKVSLASVSLAVNANLASSTPRSAVMTP